MLVPSVRSARDRAMRVVCLSHQRALALGLHEYADENRGWLPVTVQRCGAPGASRASATIARHDEFGFDLVRALSRYVGADALSCPAPSRVALDNNVNRGPVVYSNYIFLWGCDRNTPITGVERLSQARNIPAVADFTWYNDGPPPDCVPIVGGNHAERGTRAGAAIEVDPDRNPSARQFLEVDGRGRIRGMNGVRLSGEAGWFPRRTAWRIAGPYNRQTATNSFVYLPLWR